MGEGDSFINDWGTQFNASYIVIKTRMFSPTIIVAFGKYW